jgi:hypothetical protein
LGKKGYGFEMDREGEEIGKERRRIGKEWEGYEMD